MPPSSEDPNEERYLNLVRRHMLHHHTPACMKEGTTADTVCSKGYPKPLVEQTFIDDRGYVQYRRRTEQDRWVVPHNRHLLLLADCHFNVEVSSTVNLIMYLYKYMFKGPDGARYAVTQDEDRDEINDFIKARYLSASEAVWRIFGFHINHREPSVSPLKIHLPDRDYMVFRDGGEQAAATATVSELDRYLSRPLDTLFDDIQYCQYHEQFIVSRSAPSHTTTVWQDTVPAPQTMKVYRRQRGEKICRMHMLYLNTGEVFYLRLLLLHTSPRSFEDVDGTVYDNYQLACHALGLLTNETESELCFNEAREANYSPAQLRSLLILIMDGAPAVQILEANLFT